MANHVRVPVDGRLDCKKCGGLFPLDQMKKDSRYKWGYGSLCVRCHSDGTLSWQKRNPEKARATRQLYNASEHGKAQHSRQRRARYQIDPGVYRWRNLWKLYKMGRATYEALLEVQGGVCAICRAGQARPLVVDHDHQCCPKTPTCGRCTRGLLCQPCNLAMTRVVDRGWSHLAHEYVSRYALQTEETA
jgi:hypothetical protein